MQWQLIARKKVLGTKRTRLVIIAGPFDSLSHAQRDRVTLRKAGIPTTIVPVSGKEQ